MKILRHLLVLLMLGSQLAASAQQVALGQWRDHFPWSNTKKVTAGNDKVYCATELGVIGFDITDNSMQRITKANLLSDVGITTVRFHDGLDVLVVGYANGNLDLVKESNTINMGDIERSSIIGDKGIYDVYFKGDFAYLSCGFGIVVVDLLREEVKDTYIIGPNESQVQVNAVTTDDQYIWAATEEDGVFRANVNDPNLANFNNWSQVSGTPVANGPWRNMVTYDGNLFLSYNGSAFQDDTLYQYDGNTWTAFLSGTDIQSVQVTSGNLVVSQNYNARVYGPGMNEIINLFSNSSQAFTPNDAVWYQGDTWMADNERGLLKVFNPWGAEAILPNGPRAEAAWQMDVYRSQIWVSSGAFNINGDWSPIYNSDGIYTYDNGEWTSYSFKTDAALDSINTFVSIVVDPNDEDHAFMGSWVEGLVEINDGQVVNVYDQSNSSLQGDAAWNTREGIGGVEFDSDGNLWMSNTGADEPVSVYTADGVWQSFSFNANISRKSIYGMLVDRNDYVWFINKQAGLVVLDPNGTPTDDSDDQFKELKSGEGNGNLPSNSVRCMTEDLDGEIWIGTEEGVAVFYAPENIFNGNDFDAQQILLEQDGNVQILLETEKVSSITVDGANRKWIGTQGAGLFLMSEDGTEQIYRFNTDNSPLISDVINDVTIDHETGEVLIATDLGIVSFQGTATGFSDNYENVYAFPNPVREDYDGPIAIRGLLGETDVKICDIAGNLVFETISEGGTAVWNGRSLTGERAKTGVYLVFCSDKDGENTMVTKILLVN